MVEHLRIMSAMISDLNDLGEEVYEGKQVLNGIQALSNELEH